MHKINVVDMPNYKPVVMGSKKLSGSVKYQHNFFATNINFEKVARDHVHSLFVNFRLDLLHNTSVSSNRDKNLNHSFFKLKKSGLHWTSYGIILVNCSSVSNPYLINLTQVKAIN